MLVDGDDLAIASACATDAAGVWRSLDEGATIPDTGRPLSEGLAAGSYFLVETKAAPDTELDATPRDFEIADADHYAAAKAAVAVSLENRAFGASLELAKRDATSGAALAGAAFALTYVPEGGDTSQVIVVPATGDAGAVPGGRPQEGHVRPRGNHRAERLRAAVQGHVLPDQCRQRRNGERA